LTKSLYFDNLSLLQNKTWLKSAEPNTKIRHNMNYVKTKDQRPPTKQTFNARANQGGEKARVSYFISYHKYCKNALSLLHNVSQKR